MKKYIDLVVGGPDMSGTGTQIRDIIDFFQSQDMKVRDLRGTEICALFHADRFSKYNNDHMSFGEFFKDENVSDEDKQDFIFEATKRLIGDGRTNEDLRVASFLENRVSTYVNPDSADVWIMEEPTKRGAGQVNRAIEQNRTEYDSKLHPLAAAYAHQTYRIDEFLRFRRVLREKNKIIIRSRSEESGCYQVFDKQLLPNGIHKEQYITLPGHNFAFGQPPTHIFIVHAPADWTREQYFKMKGERSSGRLIDDHEANVDYQLLVNYRYATDWLDSMYRVACGLYESDMPEIVRFNMYDSKEQIKQQMTNKIKEILEKNS